MRRAIPAAYDSARLLVAEPLYPTSTPYLSTAAWGPPVTGAGCPAVDDRGRGSSPRGPGTPWPAMRNLSGLS